MALCKLIKTVALTAKKSRSDTARPLGSEETLCTNMEDSIMAKRIKTKQEWAAFNRAWDAAPTIKKGKAAAAAVEIVRQSNKKKQRAATSAKHQARDAGKTYRFAHKARVKASK